MRIAAGAGMPAEVEPSPRAGRLLSPNVRHCERSEAIQLGAWIATALRASQ